MIEHAHTQEVNTDDALSLTFVYCHCGAVFDSNLGEHSARRLLDRHIEQEYASAGPRPADASEGGPGPSPATGLGPLFTFDKPPTGYAAAIARIVRAKAELEAAQKAAREFLVDRGVV